MTRSAERSIERFRRAIAALAAVVAAWTHGGSATARADTMTVEGAPAGGLGRWGLILSVNYDDDDENLRMDYRQSPPAVEVDDDLRFVTLAPPVGTASVEVSAQGAERIRVHAEGAGAAAELPLSFDGAAPIRLAVDGVRASSAPADVRLVARFLDEWGGEIARGDLAITVVGVAFLDAANAVVDPTRASLQVSNEVTNGESLPRGNEYDAVSDADPDNFRVEVYLVGLGMEEAVVSVESRAGAGDRLRAELRPLDMAGPDGGAARSPFLRLVADAMDWTASGVVRRVLLVRLRDRVSAVVTAPDGQRASTDLRVGRPGNEDGPQAVRRARWAIHVLRLTPGGPVALGVDEDTARKIAIDQVVASNEVYAACNITFGPPEETPILIEDPPGPTLLAVADVDGLRSAGGQVRFAVNGVPVGPIVVGRHWSPHETAVAIARAVEAAGFAAEVSENARVDYGAGRSADVLIRDSSGAPVEIAQSGDHPLTTDRRQSLTIGRVDLSDRLAEFNNATSSAGTIEERTLLKALGDRDPRTIDMFIVNGFTGGGRQGEAFIEHDGGMIRNALVLDRTGITQSRAAWTQSHEAGHILLDDPYHPDNSGWDRPWMLMDANASLADVTGPKRLTNEECERIVRESGPDGSPALLERWDVVPPEHLERLEDVAVDPGYPRR